MGEGIHREAKINCAGLGTADGSGKLELRPTDPLSSITIEKSESNRNYSTQATWIAINILNSFETVNAADKDEMDSKDK